MGVLLLSLHAGACIPIGDAWFRFSGVITDEQGAPVEGARIELYVNGKLAGSRSVLYSARDGSYRVFENSCPCDFDFELRVSKSGYEPVARRMSGRAANGLERLDIALKQAAGDERGGDG